MDRLTKDAGGMFRRVLELLGCRPRAREGRTMKRRNSLISGNYGVRSMPAFPSMRWDVGPPLFGVATGYDDRRGEIAMIGFGGHRRPLTGSCADAAPVFALTVAKAGTVRWIRGNFHPCQVPLKIPNGIRWFRGAKKAAGRPRGRPLSFRKHSNIFSDCHI